MLILEVLVQVLLRDARSALPARMRRTREVLLSTPASSGGAINDGPTFLRRTILASGRLLIHSLRRSAGDSSTSAAPEFRVSLVQRGMSLNEGRLSIQE
jgi:hypothetical protein